MGLEDLTGADKFIDDLVNTNPVGATDPKSQGDDHLRGIKNVLLNTFPNITGEVSTTQAELNILAGATVVTAEINYLDLAAGVGVQEAYKAVVADANVNTGVSKITELHIGASGSETQVTADATELNLLDGLTAFQDDDTFASATDTALASSESIKAYVDSQLDAGSSAALGGDFDTGSVTWSKTGDTVTITWSASTFSSDATPSSSAGVIPADYRPTTDTMYNTVFSSPTRVDMMALTTAGTLTFDIRDWAGSASAVTTGVSGSMTFNIM